MENSTRALKSGVWFLIANFTVKAMTLFSTPIFTRLLSKEQFGEYSNFSSWAGIALIVIGMSVESSLISAKYDYENRLNQYNYSLIVFSFFTTLVWAIFVNVFHVFFERLLSISWTNINIILVFVFFHVVVNIFQVSERFQFRYKRSVAIALVVAVGNTLISILLVLFMPNKLEGIILGSVIPYILVGTGIIWYFIKMRQVIDYSIWPYVLRICIPFIPHVLSLTVLNSFDRIMINRICGAEYTALYTVAYTCGQIITILLTSMNSAFSPWLGEKLHEKDYEEIRRVTRVYLLVFCSIAILLMLIAPEVLLILGGEKYIEAKYVIAPVAMGCVCQFIYTLFVNVEQYQKKTIGMAIASVLAAITNYILNMIFIPQFGYIAAAYTTLVGYILLLVGHMIIVRMIKMDIAYDYKSITQIFVTMMFLTVIVNWLYNMQLLRYLVILIFLAGVGLFWYSNRSSVLRILKAMRSKEVT